MDYLLICMIALTEMTAGHDQTYVDRLAQTFPERLDVCLDVAMTASDHDVSIEMAVAVAYEESRFLPDVESSAGAVGPMQVIPRYHCPNRTIENCDVVDAGVNALARYKHRYQTWPEALCHYNAGNTCNDGSRRYARRVQSRAERLHNRFIETAAVAGRRLVLPVPLENLGALRSLKSSPTTNRGQQIDSMLLYPSGLGGSIGVRADVRK